MNLAFIAQAGSSGTGGSLLGFLPFIFILVIIYFLMLRPQMKKQKEHSSMLASLQKNDDVVTAGGLHGRIVQISEKGSSMQLQLAKGIIVTVERSSIARKMERQGDNPGRDVSSGRDDGDRSREFNQSDAGGGNPGNLQSGDSSNRGLVTANVGGDGRRSRPRRRSHRPSRGNRPSGQNRNTPDTTTE